MAQKQWVVPPSGDIITLEAFLKRAAQLSAADIKSHLNKGAIHVNRRRVKDGKHPLQGGERIRLFTMAKKAAQPQVKIPILYRDDHLLIVNKPAGLPIGPTKQSDRGHLMHRLCQELGLKTGQKSPLRSPHRLDREVSGLTALTLDKKSTAHLSAQFQAREAKRTYLALVRSPETPPESGHLKHRWQRDKKGVIRAIKDGQGPLMQTDFRRLGHHGGVALLALSLQSGRMHQLRVQLQAMGWQLLGDKRYRVAGPPGASEPQWPALLGHRLRLKHPQSAKEMEFYAPIPRFLKGWIAPMAIEAYDGRRLEFEEERG